MSHLVIQSLLDLFVAPAYLEVGVATGQTFHAVHATTKVAVDPNFAFVERLTPPTGCAAFYHEVTSDTYFGTIASDADRFDVIYLDGLHTFEQTLRDLNNALEFLSPRGIIVIDDVRPNSYAASLPQPMDTLAVKAYLRTESDQAWMGDVYKLVFFIETFFQQFSFATTEDNHGQLVMWRQRRSQVPVRDIDAICRLQFVHCVTERRIFRMLPFDQILRMARDSVRLAI